MALPLYALTLFVSAFILFLVQPMVAKMILPKLGGTPQVWNTCSMFFQMVLLAGYFYSHTVSTKLKLRQQLIVHGIMLLLPFLVLFPIPFNIADWSPNLGGNPLFSTLTILFLTVSLPFLVVSTSAPLLQKWFVHTGHPAAKDPYFLYGASNLGSMLALLAYPFLIEPITTLTNSSLVTEKGVSQPWIWLLCYGVLVITVYGCIALVWGRADDRQPEPRVTPEPSNVPLTKAEATTAIKPSGRLAPAGKAASGPRPDDSIALVRAREEVTWMRRLRWILLAAAPSSLMLGLTTYVTTDLSPIPLFWLLPLALYLLSFILVFARWPVVWLEQPHSIMLWCQPISIAIMLLLEPMSHEPRFLWSSIFFHGLSFFFTTMVCHGELAKDRPSPKYLTEFFLCMSVGGMLGGMFNALIAPLVFVRVIEYGIMIFAACLLRPKMFDRYWLDDMLSGLFEGSPQPAVAARGRGVQPVAAPRTDNSQLAGALDFLMPLVVLVITAVCGLLLRDVFVGIAQSMVRSTSDKSSVLGLTGFMVYLVPLVLTVLALSRPIRFGLCVGAVMLVQWLAAGQGGGADYYARSYFGVISVKTHSGGAAQPIKLDDGTIERLPYTTLIHGHINHGMNFTPPNDPKDWGNPNKDFSRLQTTYYHRLGPAGRVMEKFNWFKDGRNQFTSDTRMPSSLVATLAGDLAMGTPMPYSHLVDLWSEPPYATVGLGTGTMAAYGRPYQHVHYYEIDNQIRKLSLPSGDYFTYDNLPKTDQPFFVYLNRAIRRGCEVQVLMGDARLRMAMPYQNFHTPEGREKGGGPENFYHMMVVDAFSSDAIPAHLITKEAIEMYFKKLTEEGILCVHTSNRFVDLPRVVGSVANKLGYAWTRGHDVAPGDEVGHFTSEWVMVARKSDYLAALKNELMPPDYREKFEASRKGAFEEYWSNDVKVGPRYVWTDDYYNLVAVIR